MRIFDIISEANGIRAGNPGEPYTDSNGVEYKFQSWNWQFPKQSDTYESPEAMSKDILALTGGDNNKILWINEPTSRTKSFGVAKFATDGYPTKEIWVGGFYQKKSANNTILDKQIKEVSGLSAGTADKPASSAVKAEARLKPFDLGIADGTDRSVSSIIAAVSEHANGAMLAQALTEVTKKQPVIFKNSAKMISALQDDFGEVLSPVAMISNSPQLIGTLDLAIKDVFKGKGLKGATINYPASQTNGLIDSYIHNAGMELAVSSKGKKGANGSINNIWKAMQQSKETVNGQAYINEFPEAVDILETCKKYQRDAPLYLGRKFGLINEGEFAALEELMKDARSPSQQLAGDPKNPSQIVKTATPKDLAKVPQALRRIFSMGGYKAGSFVGFICLARVASLVAQHVNSDPEINFGEAIRSFLNSSAMVQVKCTIKAAGNDAVLQTVNVIYPPNFTQKAKMESNWYSGKQIKGGFSFSLPTS